MNDFGSTQNMATQGLLKQSYDSGDRVSEALKRRLEKKRQELESLGLTSEGENADA